MTASTDQWDRGLTWFHPEHARERFLGVFQRTVSVVQDPDAIPQFRIL